MTVGQELRRQPLHGLGAPVELDEADHHLIALGETARVVEHGVHHQHVRSLAGFGPLADPQRHFVFPVRRVALVAQLAGRSDKTEPDVVDGKGVGAQGPVAAAGVTRDRHFARPATSPSTARVPASVAYQAASERPRRACFTSPSLARLVRTSWAQRRDLPGRWSSCTWRAVNSR